MASDRPELRKRAANFVPLSPVSFLKRAADFFGDRTAVIHGARRFTYREFYARARRLAHALTKAGIKRGDTVAILAANMPAMLEAHYAAPMIGAILNPINIRLDAPLIAFCLEHGEAKLLLADREFHATIAPALEKLGSKRPIVVDIADAETAGAPSFGGVEYEDFIAAGDPAFAYAGPGGRVGQHLPALHVGHHRQSQGRGLQPSRRLPRRARQRADLQARPREPLSVDAADVPLLGLDLYMGGDGGRRARTCACARWSRSASSNAIAEHRVTHMCGAPIVLNMLVHAPGRAPSGRCRCAPRWRPAARHRPPSSSSAWRRWVSRCCTSTARPRATDPRPTARRCRSGQGLPTDERYARMARQGIPNPVIEHMAVADPETLAPVPRDGATIGEIMLAGNTLMKGYLKNEAATEEAFAGGLLSFRRPRRVACRRQHRGQGPLQGHHHLRRREHLLAGGRGGALSPSAGDGGGGGGPPRRRSGARPRARSSR